jgi:hypothetical protein
VNRERLLLAGVTLVLWGCFGRASVIAEPLPWWDGDPFASITAVTGITPAWSLALDSMIAAGAALTFAAAGRVGLPAVLAAAGACAAAVRTHVLDGGNTEALHTAGGWIAGWFALAAVATAVREQRARRLVSAAFVGFAAMLLAKSLAQFAFEHPSVVAQYDADPEAALAARGFTPGSPAALQFERRLRQPDISAWFGLSNVLAAVLVAASSALALTTLAARTAAPRWMLAVLMAATGLAVAGAITTGSKAGIAVLAVIGIAAFTARVLSKRAAIVIGLAAWLLPIAAILGRAVTGMPGGELSLLFRSFYLRGGAGIIRDHWLTGVGPDGFRDAYQLVRLPEATESVTSAHNATIDLAADLGLFALPWLVLLPTLAALAGRGLRTTLPTAVRSARRGDILLLAAWAVVPTLLSAALEAEATTIELALARLLGLLGWIGLGSVLLRTGVPKAGLCAAGLAVLIHAQVDMVLFLPGSTPLALALVGMLAAGTLRLGGRRIAAGLVALAAGGAIWTGANAVRVSQWERELTAAAEPARAIAARRDSLARDGMLGPELDRAAREASDRLERAWAMFPDDERPLMSAVHVRLLAHENARRGGRAGLAEEHAEAAERIARIAAEARPTSQTMLMLGSVCSRRAEWLTSASHLDAAVEARARSWSALMEADSLDPASPTPALRLALEAARAGDTENAAIWARRALERDAAWVLDPLAGLGDRERATLSALADRTGKP